MGRKMRVTILFALLGVVLTASAAVAQEYGESLGDLGVSTGPFAPGDSFDIFGDGFLEDSAVIVSLTSNADGSVVDLGSVTSDSNGAVASTLSLPFTIVDGAYTVSAMGVTADGATRILSGVIVVLAEAAVEETTTTTTTEAVTETTVVAEVTTTTADPADAGAPEALPFEGDGDDGGSNTGVARVLTIVAFVVAGGIAWWRYRVTTR